MRTLCIGIDPSLRGTAIAAVVDGNVFKYEGWTDKKYAANAHPELHWYKPKDSQDDQRIHRSVQVADWVIEKVQSWQRLVGLPAFVSIEGYAMSQRSNRYSDLCELGGLIKQHLWRARIPYRIYTPQHPKMAWAGSGRAEKQAMIEACLRHTGIDLTHYCDSADNLADAILLSMLLDCELVARFDLQRHLPSKPHEVLTRQTKKDVAILDRPFILFKRERFRDPIY